MMTFYGIPAGATGAARIIARIGGDFKRNRLLLSSSVAICDTRSIEPPNPSCVQSKAANSSNGEHEETSSPYNQHNDVSNDEVPDFFSPSNALFSGRGHTLLAYKSVVELACHVSDSFLYSFVLRATGRLRLVVRLCNSCLDIGSSGVNPNGPD